MSIWHTSGVCLLVNVLPRSMTTVSEKLGWPVKVDYPGARVEDRKAFECIFLDLLKLQDL